MFWSYSLEASVKSMPTISWLAFGIDWKKGRPLIEILEKKRESMWTVNKVWKGTMKEASKCC